MNLPYIDFCDLLQTDIDKMKNVDYNLLKMQFTCSQNGFINYSGINPPTYKNIHVQIKIFAKYCINALNKILSEVRNINDSAGINNLFKG